MHHATMPQYQQNWQWTTLLKYDMSAAKPTAHPRVMRTSNLQVTYLTIFRITERQEVRAPQLATRKTVIFGFNKTVVTSSHANARDEAAAAAPPLANLIGTLHHCLLGFPDIEHQT